MSKEFDQKSIFNFEIPLFDLLNVSFNKNNVLKLRRVRILQRLAGVESFVFFLLLDDEPGSFTLRN